MRGKKTR